MMINRKQYDESDYNKIKNFDKTYRSAQKAIEQLKIIQQVILNFQDLKVKLEADREHGDEIKQLIEQFWRGEEIK